MPSGETGSLNIRSARAEKNDQTAVRRRTNRRGMAGLGKRFPPKFGGARQSIAV
jgi:hypothetical protein